MSYTSKIDTFFSSHFLNPEDGIKWAKEVVNSPVQSTVNETLIYELFFQLNFLQEGFSDLKFEEQTRIATVLLEKPLETSRKIKEILKRYLTRKFELVFLTTDNKAVVFSRQEVEKRNKYLADFDSILIPFKKSTLELVRTHFRGNEIEVTDSNYDELLQFADMFDCDSLKSAIADFAFKKIDQLYEKPNYIKYVDGVVFHPRKKFSIQKVKVCVWEYLQVDELSTHCEITMIENCAESFRILRHILVLFPKVILKLKNFSPELNPCIRSLMYETHLVGLEVDVSHYNEVDLMFLSSILKNCPNITWTNFPNLPYLEFSPNLNSYNSSDVKLVSELFESLSCCDVGIRDLYYKWDTSPPRSIEILKQLLPMITGEILAKSANANEILSELLDRFPSFVQPFYLGSYSYKVTKEGDYISSNVQYCYVDQRLAGHRSPLFQDCIKGASKGIAFYHFRNRNANKEAVMKLGLYLANGNLKVESVNEAINLFELAYEAQMNDLLWICYRCIIVHLTVHPSKKTEFEIRNWAKTIGTKMFNHFFRNLPETPDE